MEVSFRFHQQIYHQQKDTQYDMDCTVGPRTHQDVVVKRKIHVLEGNRTLAVQT